MGRAVIIYGPQGCGKTTHAKQIAQHFGKAEVIEAGDLPSDFWKGAPFSNNALVLTNDQALAMHHGEHFGAKVYTFNEAMLACGINERQPYQTEGHPPPGELLEGIKPGFIAMRRTRAPYEKEAMIDVFDSFEDGSRPLEGRKKLFSVPATWTAEHINVALEIERLSYLDGERDGRASAQFEIRKALGLR
jgi:hypothetical protein